MNTVDSLRLRSLIHPQDGSPSGVAMKLVQIVLLFGSHCVSPMEHMEGLSEVGKVPCAIIVHRDTETNAVTTEPPGLAAAPEVVAVLGTTPLAAPPQRPVAARPPPRQAEVRIVPVADTATASKPRAMARNPRAERPSAKGRAAKAPPDRCGSYKAVWYTNTSGKRRYRCVKQG